MFLVLFAVIGSEVGYLEGLSLDRAGIKSNPVGEFDHRGMSDEVGWECY